MNRRSFLKILAGSAATAAVAPTYFFAPIGGWKSDVIINPTYSFKDIQGALYLEGELIMAEDMSYMSLGPATWSLDSIARIHGICRKIDETDAEIRKRYAARTADYALPVAGPSRRMLHSDSGPVYPA